MRNSRQPIEGTMKRILRLLIIILPLLTVSCERKDLNLREGDIIFQTSLSSQSRAIQLATGSKYSHMGIILDHNGKLMVYEAVGPAKFTSITSWIKRGSASHFVVKRLVNADSVLTKRNVFKLDSVAETFVGKPYDLGFNWSDERLYCSELVWKIFDRALNIQLGRLQALKDFDLSNTEVQTVMRKRYPRGIPLDETVISPEQIFQSPLLKNVHEE